MEKNICENYIEKGRDIDYIGKLNDHGSYLKMLKVLERKCKYIAIECSHEIIDEFQNDIVKYENSNKRWGTWTSIKLEVTFIKTSKKLFEYLKKYETICKYITNVKKVVWGIEFSGDKVELTSFGYNSIAFYDENFSILLCTNTHEGFIDVRDDIDAEYKKC